MQRKKPIKPLKPLPKKRGPKPKDPEAILPPKLTVTLMRKVCRLIRNGNWIDSAAAVVGISRQTLRSWLKKGRDLVRQAARAQFTLFKLKKEEKTDTPEYQKALELLTECKRPRARLYAAFSQRVQVAVAQADSRDIKVIDDCAQQGDWRAAGHKIRLRHPELREKHHEHKHEHQTNINSTQTTVIKIEALGLTLEQRKTLLERIRAQEKLNEVDRGRLPNLPGLLPAQESNGPILPAVPPEPSPEG